MPRIIRIRYHTDNLPGHALTAGAWLTLLTREELVRLHEWAEPWPLLWTLSDREAVNYARRYHPDGPAAFLVRKDSEEIILDPWRSRGFNATPVR